MKTGAVCFTNWAGIDSAGAVRYVVIQGVGINVDTNNAKGIKNVTCHFYQDYSQPVWAADLFTGEAIEVTLLSIDDACAAFGVTPCPRRGDNGTAMFGPDNVGGVCTFAVGSDTTTTDWRRHITPSGKDLLLCKFPARRPE